MMMRIFITLLFLSVTASAQSIGTGLTFLKNGGDARSAAMGEAGTASGGEHSSYFLNPATLRATADHQLLFGHRQGFADVTSDYLGATIPGKTFTFGVAAFTTSVGGIEVRQRPGDADGTFSARNGALGAGIAMSLSDALSVGVSGKLLYEKIYIDEASGYAVDAGVTYAIDNELSAGASVANLGSMSVLRSAASELPAMIRAGIAYGRPITEEIRVNGAADIVKTLKDDGMHLHIGAEALYQSQFMLRLGYQSGYETRSVALGGGVRYGPLRVDYAFVPMTGAFTPNHTISLMFTL